MLPFLSNIFVGFLQRREPWRARRIDYHCDYSHRGRIAVLAGRSHRLATVVAQLAESATSFSARVRDVLQVRLRARTVDTRCIFNHLRARDANR